MKARLGIDSLIPVKRHVPLVKGRSLRAPSTQQIWIQAWGSDTYGVSGCDEGCIIVQLAREVQCLHIICPIRARCVCRKSSQRGLGVPGVSIYREIVVREFELGVFCSGGSQWGQSQHKRTSTACTGPEGTTSAVKAEHPNMGGGGGGSNSRLKTVYQNRVRQPR